MNTDARHPYTFVAIGPHCYGMGFSPEIAEANAARNWPRTGTGVKRPSAKHFSLYITTGTPAVDEIGRLTSTEAIHKLRTSVLAD